MESQNKTEDQIVQPATEEVSSAQVDYSAAPAVTSAGTAYAPAPKKPNFIVKHWLPLALGVVLLSCIAFGAYQAFFANYFKKQYDDTNTLYLAEVSKSTVLEQQLTDLNLDKTQLESIKSDLEKENDELDTKAETAEEKASALQGSLSAKTEELQKKAAELTAMNSSLAAKKAELDKAQRGVAKFTEVEKLYASFKSKSDEFITHTGNCIGYIIQFLNTGTEKYIYMADDELGAADAVYGEMEKLNVQMNVIFNEIKAGNY